MAPPLAENYVLVSRYVRPKDGRVITHVYLGEQGTGWPTRSKALTARKHHLKELREREGSQLVNDLMAKGDFSLIVVQPINL